MRHAFMGYAFKGHARRHRVAVLALLLPMSMLVPRRTWGQQPAHDTTRDTVSAVSITGRVRGPDGRPVPRASVWVDASPPTAASGDSATFALRDVAPGTHALHVRALGFAPFDTAIVVRAGTPLSLTLALRPVATQLDSVRVQARAPLPVHRTNGSGTVLTHDGIAQRNVARFGELLRGMPGVTAARVTNDFGGVDYVYVMRGTSTVLGQVCPIAFFLDDSPVDLPTGGIDGLVRPADLDSIAVFPNGSQAPARYGTTRSGRCGVIALWTRGGH